MGATSSRPTTTPTPPSDGAVVEKPGFPRDADSHSQHHSTDRLQRIAAEHDIKTSSRSASASLDVATYKHWQTKIENDPVSRLAALTLHNTNIKESLRVRKAEVEQVPVFNVTIEHDNDPITDQKSSGRCWLFASHNCIRNEMMKTFDIEKFQLSQSYPFFWDHVEKSNWFLEQTLSLYDQPVDDRVFSTLKADPVGDGGQFDMAANLLRKYGCVPQALYPESFNSSSTGGVDKILTTTLRHNAIKLRKLKSDVVSSLQAASAASISSKAQCEAKANIVCRKAKDEMMEEIYRLLMLAAGAPPKPDEPFTFEYRNKAGKFVSITSTPKEFLKKYAPKWDIEGQASLVHDPRNETGKLMTVDRLGNVVEGNPVRYVSAGVDELAGAAIKQIKAGLPVFYGCDVGQFSNSSLGIMDTALYDYSPLSGPSGHSSLSMTKGERISYGESLMTHAMVLCGVHLDSQGTPVRWRVENSWGANAGPNGGYFVMSHEWFKEYVYQVVVKRQFMKSEHWDLFERGVDDKTIVLPIYDPLGALA